MLIQLNLKLSFSDPMAGLSCKNVGVFWSSFCIQAVFLLICFGWAAHAIDGNKTDRLALLDFKAGITEDPLEIISSWNESVNLCQWNGVKCGLQHQRVTVCT